MKVWGRSSIPYVFAVALLSACGTQPSTFEEEPVVRGVPSSYVSDETLSHNRTVWNATTAPSPNSSAEKSLRAKSSMEADWITTRTNGRSVPFNCVAFSGGGMRSAMFSIGVLRGLSELELLRHVDIISAVSGGSYAATALYAQAYSGRKDARSPINVDAIFDEAFIEGVKSNSRLFQEWEWLLLIPEALKGVPTNAYDNAVYLRHTNTNELAEEYRKRLVQMFYSRPNGEYSSQSNAQVPDLFWTAFKKDDGLPYLIVNGTVNFAPEGNESSVTLAQQIFELTPLFFGSDGVGRFGYLTNNLTGDSSKTYLGQVDYRKSPLLSLAMATSGGAFDSTIFGNAELRRAISAINLDLGRFYLNPNVPEAKRHESDATPVPYLDTGSLPNRWDSKGHSFLVTDGGHSENLGAFSLIRRGCRHIMIVDAESDPEYKFDSYVKLRDRLQRAEEMGVTLNVPRIEFSLKNLAAATAKQQGDRKTDFELSESRWNDFGHHPIDFGGSVKWIPVPIGDSLNGPLLLHKLNVTYLKLGYPLETECAKEAEELCLGDYSNKARSHTCGDINAYRCKALKKSTSTPFGFVGLAKRFPQEGTYDLNFSREQTNAYIELGRLVVLSHKERISEAFLSPERK